MMARELVTGQIKRLRPLPPTALRLASLLASPLYSIDECVTIIKYDEALALEVLTYANSAFSGAQRQISDIRSAVIRLGGGRILKEILSRHLKTVMTGDLSAYGYSETELWRHSVAAALAIESLGPFLMGSISGLAFTAALMHDIGKLILARAAPKETITRIWAILSDETCTCEQAEKEILGFTHADVGAEIMVAWKMPECIERCVRNHHTMLAQADPLTDCVSVANVVAKSVGQGIGNEGMCFGYDSRVVDRMGLTAEIFERICVQTADRMREVLSFFEIEPGPDSASGR